MTDQETLAAFDPLFAPFSSMDRLAKGPPLLAHYTSISVMEKILQTNELWFSNPLFMNDLQEMRFGLQQGAALFSDTDLLKKAGGSDHRAALLQHGYNNSFQSFDMKEAFDTYIFCLSEHAHDDTDGALSMWRGYGQHGNGAALVFDPAKVTMVESSPLIISIVKYASNEERIEQLKSILEDWAELCSGLSIPDDKLYLASHMAFYVIKTHALTTKHCGFWEEREWRVIYYPERDATRLLKDQLGYHIGPRGVEPKLKFKIGHIANVSAPDLALDRLLDRIILGPSLSSLLAKRSIERMLEKIGKPGFKTKLQTSEIPLRPESGTSF